MKVIAKNGVNFDKNIYFLMLDKLSQQLTANPAQNIQKIVEFTHHILNGACSFYNKLNQRNQSLISWATENTPENLPESDQAAGHICYEATIKGKEEVVVIEDISQTAYRDSDPYVRKYHLQAYLGAPVRNGKQSYGALCIVDTKPRQFSDLEVQLIRHLANILRIQEERLRVDRTQTVLYKLARSLMTSKNIHELAGEIKNHIKDVIDIDYLALITPDSNADHYISYSPDERKIIPKNSAENFLIEALRKTGKPLLLDAKKMKTFLPEKLSTDIPFHSWLGAPLLLDDQFIGVISIASFDGQNYISDDLNLLEFISYEIAHILHEKQLEENLREKEEAYRTIFEGSPIGMYRTDFSGNILMANSALASMLEYDSVEELLHINLNNTFHPDYQRKSFLELLENNEKVIFDQTTWQTSKNNVIFVRERAKLNQHNSYVVIDGIVEDITAEVNSKNAYLFEKQKFDTLSQKIPLGIFQVDNNQKIINCNKQVERITGYTGAEINDLESFFNKIRPGHQPVYDFTAIDKTATTTIHTKKGLIRCVKILRTEMIDSKYLVTIEDVTDTLRAKDDLVNQSKYLSAINSVTDLLISERKVPYQKILKLIANTMNLQRAVFLKTELKGDLLTTSRLAAWNSDHLPEKSYEIQNNINVNRELPNWRKEILQKGYIYGNDDDFMAPEQNFLKKIGIRSVYVHRVNINKHLYGVIALEEFNQKRTWTKNDRILIHSIAATLTKFIEQKTMQQQLEDSKTSYMDLFQNSSFGIVIFDSLGKILNINEKALNLFDQDKDIIKKRLNRLWNDNEITAAIQSSVDFCNTMNISKRIEILLEKKTSYKVLDLDFKKMQYFDSNCIIMYVHDMTEQYQREQQIKENLKEKHTLLQEIHHRVKNNLQVISSLLNLQLKDIETEHDRELFIDSQNRIKSIALIHESLYHTDNLAKINLRTYTENLISRLFTVFKVDFSRIKYDIQIPTTEIDLKKAIPCGLILDELITNSLKYAFPNGRKGKIIISLDKTDQDYKMTIKDNGIGFKHENLLKEKSTLGFELVVTLAKQLKGNYKIIDGQGFGMEIIFPGEA